MASSLAMVLKQEELRRDFGAMLGRRTGITRAQREATWSLGLLSKRPKKTSCAGTANGEKAALSRDLTPNVSPSRIRKAKFGLF